MKATTIALSLLPVLVCGAGLASCGSTGTGEDPGGTAGSTAPPNVKLPWTPRFLSPAILVAEVVVIEGPEDLLDHIAIRQDPEFLEYTVETTTDGLLQEVVRRSAMVPTEIHAQLDAWTIRAMQRLVVLQRPGDVPVLVRAQGNAVWIETGGGEELREPELEFRGERP